MPHPKCGIMQMHLSRLSFLILSVIFFPTLGQRSFTIDNDAFLKNGEPITLISASIHYHRIPPEYWEDRLLRLKAMGLNAIQTYVPWNFHNPSPGKYNFENDRDLGKWLDLANTHGLLVLLRAGPYICGEWEFGGFPSWLLAIDPPVTLRTYEPGYMKEVATWWNTLFQNIVKPRLYLAGGPIIMVQIENEFGSYGDVSTKPLDKQYMETLVTLARQNLGQNVILYTTDGGDLSYMTRGSLSGDIVYTVGDFGPGSNPSVSFSAQKQMNAPGKSPNMNTEFYSGWLTHYGEKIANTSTSSFTQYLDRIFSLNGSVSIYMGHGGTNFGFFNGANTGGNSNDFHPSITSYDYNSPINENGDHGFGSDGLDKFVATKNIIKKYVTYPIPSEPAPVPRTAYGPVTFSQVFSLWDNRALLCPNPISGVNPISMEKLGQDYGFTLYSSTLTGIPVGTHTLEIDTVHDRAQIFINQKFSGTIFRQNPSPISVSIPQLNSKVDILLENMGRVNYGPYLTDSKGIGSLKINSQVITNWTMCTLPLDGNQLRNLKYSHPFPGNSGTPSFYKASLQIPGNPTDTYINTRGWSKGNVFMNSVNAGRYWETEGPQHALYIPKSMLSVSNPVEILVFELENANPKGTMTFTGVQDF